MIRCNLHCPKLTDNKVFPLSKAQENFRDLLSLVYFTLNSEVPTYNNPVIRKTLKLSKTRQKIHASACFV